jgi:hypothetical protein
LIGWQISEGMPSEIRIRTGSQDELRRLEYGTGKIVGQYQQTT